MSVRRVSRRHAVASGVLFRAVMSASAGVMAWGTAMLVPAGEAHAQTTIWTGATNNLWFTNTNWSPNTVPSGAGTTVSFQGSTNTTILVGSNTTVGSFRFDSATPFTLNAGVSLSSLDLGAPTGNVVSVNGAGNATVNFRFAFGGTSTVSATGANLIAAGGGIVNASATVTIAPAANRTIQWGAPVGAPGNGTWTIGSGSRVRFVGPGSTTLNTLLNTVNNTSAVEVLGGTLSYLSGALNATTVSGTGVLRLFTTSGLTDRLTVGAGGTVENAAATSLTLGIPVNLDSGRIFGAQRVIFSGGLSVAGTTNTTPRIDSPVDFPGINVPVTFNVFAPADLELNGPLHGPSVTFSGAGAAVIRLMTGTSTGSTLLRINMASTQMVLGVESNSPILPGGTIAFTGTSTFLRAEPGIGRIRATIEHSAVSSYTLSTAGFAADDFVVTSAGTVTFSGGASITNDFTRVLNNGRINRSGVGNVIAASFVNNGLIQHQVAGHLNITDALTNNGAIFLNGTATLNAPVAFTNAGTTTLFGGVANVGSLANSGTIAIGGGTLNVNSLSNTGSISYTFGNISGTVTNSGSLTALVSPFAASYVHASPAASLSGTGGTAGLAGVSGTITFTGGATFNAETSLTAGALLRNAGSLPVTFNSDLNLNGGTLNAAPNSVFINNARVSGPGALHAPGTFVNLRTWTVDGRLSLAVNAIVSNAATFSVTSTGTLDLASATFFSNSGTFSLSDALVTGTGNIINRPGGLITGSGRISAPVNNQSGATLQPANGTLTLDANFTNAGLIRITPLAPLAGSGTISNIGRIQGDGSIANTVVQSGRIEPAGTLALAVPLAMAVSTSVIQLNPGSTLLLSSGFSGNQHLGILSLSGGTLDTNATPVTNTFFGSINGHGQLLTGSLRNSGSITLAGGTSLITGAVTNDAARTLRVQAGTAVFNSPVTNNGTISVLAGGNAVFAGSPNVGVPSSGGPGANAVQGTGSTSLSANTTAESDGITQSSLALAAGSVYTVTSREPTGVVSLPGRTSPASLSVLGSLSIAPTALLDLTTNDLIVRNGNVASLMSAVATWWNAGARNGAGLGSTSASAADFTTIAVFPNSADGGLSPFYDTYRGTLIGPADAVVRFAHLGDTNIDGIVDARDLANLIEGLSTNATGWHNGDLNYDGTVTGADYALFASAYAAYQAGSLPPLGAPGDAGSGQGGVVPEPSTALALLAPGAILLGRRRR